MDQLEKAKNGNGLKAFYDNVTVEFIEKWESPLPPKIDRSITDPEEVKQLLDAYRTTVSS